MLHAAFLEGVCGGGGGGKSEWIVSPRNDEGGCLGGFDKTMTSLYEGLGYNHVRILFMGLFYSCSEDMSCSTRATLL